MTKISVVLTGKTKAGKDETCKILLNFLPPDTGFQRVALADTLKCFVATVRGVPVQDMIDPEKKEIYRGDLIFAGKIGRLIDSNAWVNFIKKPAVQGNIICTDARFKNELEFFESLPQDTQNQVETITVRIKASDESRIERGANPAFFTDESETDLDYLPDRAFDFVIENDGSLAQLEDQVKRLESLLLAYLA
jgi:phosphomevalonate kinase